MHILGITGGVATGKSTVTKLFRDLGAPVASADEFARELLRPGEPAALAVLAAFPESRNRASAEPDAVDRPALARLVFADPDARARLEDIIHPPVIARLTVEIAVLRLTEGGPRAAAIEIPLLFECSLEPLVDKIVVVSCPEELQIERLMSRTGIVENEARRQIASQWPLAEKAARADFVIDSSASPEALSPQVLGIWNSI